MSSRRWAQILSRMCFVWVRVQAGHYKSEQKRQWFPAYFRKTGAAASGKIPSSKHIGAGRPLAELGRPLAELGIAASVWTPATTPTSIGWTSTVRNCCSSVSLRRCPPSGCLLAAKRVWREASDRLEERITGEATESAELASASALPHATNIGFGPCEERLRKRARPVTAEASDTGGRGRISKHARCLLAIAGKWTRRRAGLASIRSAVSRLTRPRCLSHACGDIRGKIASAQQALSNCQPHIAKRDDQEHSHLSFAVKQGSGLHVAQR